MPDSLDARVPAVLREAVARDLRPVKPLARPAVRVLFRRLTVVWAAANLGIATLTLMLLWWLPLAAFVAMKQVSALGITFGAVFVTISLSLRTARREGLIAATVPARLLVA